jgi:rSAM/selenodomain-associated transferase 2
MRAALSVVIPTLNAERRLAATLGALFEGLEAGIIRELVISDGGSGDGTARIADEAGAVILTGSASRGGQLRRGTSLAKGAWVLVLHADTVLPQGWAEHVQAHMAQGSGAAVFRLGFDARGAAPFLVAHWANLRTRLFGLPYGDQGLLISQALLDKIGGYPDQVLMEDVALARRLKAANERITLLPLTVRTSASRYQERGWIRQGARNLWFLLRYLLGADPALLGRAYRR